MKNKILDKAVMLSLVLASFSGGNTEAFEIGIENVGGTVVKNEPEIILSKKSLDDKVFGVFNAGAGSLTVNDVMINVESNTREAYGIYNWGGSVFNGGNLQIIATSNAGSEIIEKTVWGITTSGGTFTSKDITLDITGKGSEVYGLQNINRNNFTANNIKITGSNKGNFIALTNKWSQNNFVADDITIKADASGDVVGIENFGDSKFTANNVDISLSKNSGDDRRVVGIYNYGELTLNKVNIQIDLAGNRSSDGVIGMDLRPDPYVTNHTTHLNGEIKIGIKGAAEGNTFGINSSLETLDIKGNLSVDLVDAKGSVVGGLYASGTVDMNGTKNTVSVNGNADVLTGMSGKTITIAAGSINNIRMEHTGSNLGEMHGVVADGFRSGANAVLNIDLDSGSAASDGATGAEKGTIGILGRNGISELESGSRTNIIVKGNAVNNDGYNGTVGISGSIKAEGDVNIDVQSKDGIGLRVISNDEFAEYKGNVVVNTNNGSAVAILSNGTAADGKLIINPDDGKKTQLTGNVKHFTDYDTKLSTIDISFNTADSFLTGMSIGANLDKRITNLSFNNASVWNMTGNSVVTELANNNAATVDMTADSNAFSTLTTEKLSGNGGIIKQDIDVRSMYSDKVLVKDDFSGTQVLDIYQKDNYVPDNESTEGIGLVLARTNGNGIFTAKDREGTLFYTHYDLAKRASNTFGFTTDWYLDKIIKTDDLTTSVKTILSTNALNYHTWRTENDKLLQRMGELRQNGDDIRGAWVRVKGSKIGRTGKFGFENKYTTYELGYDELTKNTVALKRYQGAAISYTNGSGRYSSGSGDNSNKSISFYNTEIGNKGHYLDVVFKISNMDNDFTVYDTNSSRVTGDFNNTGVSLSAEYGCKNALQNGWYIEPQAQFTLGYLGGDSYTTSNGIEVSQSGIKSAVGRIGFNIGKELGNNGIVYAKANLLHEFGGSYDVMMTDNSGAVNVKDSFDDTWFEYGIGAAFAPGKNSQLYFNVERSTGSEFRKEWQWNAGVRLMF